MSAIRSLMYNFLSLCSRVMVLIVFGVKLHQTDNLVGTLVAD